MGLEDLKKGKKSADNLRASLYLLTGFIVVLELCFGYAFFAR